MNQKRIDHPIEIVDILRRLPTTFTEALVMLMKWRGITGEALAEAALISPPTISRLRNDPDYEISIEIIIAICIGLHLPPTLYLVLIQKAGHCFKATMRHIAYQQLLPQAYFTGLNIFQFNDALIIWGVDPIGQTL